MPDVLKPYQKRSLEFISLVGKQRKIILDHVDSILEVRQISKNELIVFYKNNNNNYFKIFNFIDLIVSKSNSITFPIN